MMLRSVATGVVLVLVGGLSTTPASGADVFKDNCASCHGVTGHADTTAGKALKVPQLAGDAKVAAMSPAELIAAFKANEKHKGLVKKLSDDDIAAATAHAKELAGTK